MISQKKRKSSSQYENEVSDKVVVDFTKDCQKENSFNNWFCKKILKDGATIR